MSGGVVEMPFWTKKTVLKNPKKFLPALFQIRGCWESSSIFGEQKKIECETVGGNNDVGSESAATSEIFNLSW